MVRQAAPNYAKLIDDGGDCAQRPARTRQDVWAYEGKPPGSNYLVLTNQGVEEMDGQTLRQKLGGNLTVFLHASGRGRGRGQRHPCPRPPPKRGGGAEGFRDADRLRQRQAGRDRQPSASTASRRPNRRRLHPALLLAPRADRRRVVPDVPRRGRRTQGRQGHDGAEGRPRLPDAGQGRHRHRHREYDKRDESAAALPYDPNYKPGDRAKKSQADTLEGLLLNHPLDCPVCDKAGECKLQDFSYEFGRSESRMIDQKNTPPNKPDIGSTITLFTDRCIMCTRCVRFTREVSGTAELTVINRGHHSEIDVFPGRAAGEQAGRQRRGPVPGRGAGQQGLPLQAARLEPEGDRRRLPRLLSTGCSVHVDANKTSSTACGRGRTPTGAGLLHVRRGPARLPLRQLPASASLARRMAGQRAAVARTPVRKLQGRSRRRRPGLVGVLSPFLTCEEAYLLAKCLKAHLAGGEAGARPGAGRRRGRHVPEGRRGNPVEPAKFTSGREVPEPPRRRGGAAALPGEVTPFAEVVVGRALMVFVGGYPDRDGVESALGTNWTAPAAAARGAGPVPVGADRGREVRPAGDGRLREGRHVRQPRGAGAGFRWAVRPPTEVRGEVQIASTCSAARGWPRPRRSARSWPAVVAEFAGLVECAADSARRSSWHDRLRTCVMMPEFNLLNTALMIAGVLAS